MAGVLRYMRPSSYSYAIREQWLFYCRNAFKAK